MAREEKQSCPEKLVAIRRGESNRRGPLPPLEVAGSRQGGPEQPWGAGWPPGEGRAADGISSPWRWLVVARAARSSQGNMEAHVGAGGHQERREQPAGRKCYGFSRWALSAKRIARLCVSRAK